MNRNKYLSIFAILFLFSGCSNTHYRAEQIVAELDNSHNKTLQTQKTPLIETKPTQENETNTLQEEVDTLETNKDYNALKDLTDKNSNAVYYIKDDALRLAMTGPKGLKVGDIREYLKNKKSELVLLSMIKQQEIPYKKFTFSEIDLLTQMGLTDKVIATMIDITTSLLHDEKLRKQQEYYLAEEKKIAATQQSKVVYQNVQNQTTLQQPNQLTDKVENEVIKQGVGILLDQLFHR